MSLALNILAVFALIAVALVPLRPGAGRDPLFWGSTALALATSAAFSVALLSGVWRTDLSTALWVSITTTTLLFVGLAAIAPSSWRLAPLLMPYLAVVGFLASFARVVEPPPLGPNALMIWMDIHILISVITYGLLTLAAVASLAVLLQERALKYKRPNALTRILPAVVEADRLAWRLLLAGEIVLGLGILTGMALQYFEAKALFHMGHKAVFAVVVFVLIAALLIGHRVCGVRGRMAARVVLVAYLLLALAFPGVKFVTQFLL